jgi:hypothetical protein
MINIRVREFDFDPWTIVAIAGYSAAEVLSIITSWATRLGWEVETQDEDDEWITLEDSDYGT